MSGFIRSFAFNRRGTALIEFVVVFPIMVLMYLGCVELSQMVRAKAKVDNAAQAMVNLIATQASVNTAAVANFCTGAEWMMSPYSGTGLKIAVASVTSSQSGTLSTDWQDTTCGNATAMPNPTQLVPNLTNGDTVLIAQASYPYASAFKFVLKLNYTLSQTAYARPRVGGTVTHQ